MNFNATEDPIVDEYCKERGGGGNHAKRITDQCAEDVNNLQGLVRAIGEDSDWPSFFI